MPGRNAELWDFIIGVIMRRPFHRQVAILQLHVPGPLACARAGAAFIMIMRENTIGHIYCSWIITVVSSKCIDCGD